LAQAVDLTEHRGQELDLVDSIAIHILWVGGSLVVGEGRDRQTIAAIISKSKSLRRAFLLALSLAISWWMVPMFPNAAATTMTEEMM
jgi:hypothetical protein